MTRTRRRIIATFAIVLCGTAIFYVSARRIESHRRERREQRYQQELARFTQLVKPSWRRQEVEQYLRMQHEKFSQLCCIDAPRDAYADLVEVGREQAPWYCNRNIVYIAFEFASTEPHVLMDARPSDRLVSVRVYHHLEECL